MNQDQLRVLEDGLSAIVWRVDQIIREHREIQEDMPPFDRTMLDGIRAKASRLQEFVQSLEQARKDEEAYSILQSQLASDHDAEIEACQ